MKIAWFPTLRMLARLLGVLALASPLSAQDGPKIVLTRLTDSIYVAEDGFFAQENSLVYLGPRFVTVIGATWTPRTAELLAAEISKITPMPIREVLDTNHDLDRVGGNGFFRSIGARIVSTKLTRDLLRQDGPVSVDQARRSLGYPDVEIVLPDTVYEGDFTLQDGGIQALYLGPSHKPDDIFVYFPKEKVLYGGCILKEQLGNLDGADLVEYPKTLQKLKDLNLPITTIVAGHFSPLHGPELIDWYLRMLASRNG